MTTAGLNNLSPKLTELLKKHALKPGEVAIFKLLREPIDMQLVDEKNRPHNIKRLPNSISLKQRQRIIDPGTGGQVQIANVISWRPGTVAGAPQEPVITPLEFLGTNNGFLRITADNPVALARLLLDDKNKDSINPSARIPASGYLYERVRPELTAKEQYEKLTRNLEAKAAVAELDEAGVRLITRKVALPLEENGRTLTEYELRVRLLGLADVDANRLLSAIDAGETKLEQLIAQAVAAGVIVANHESQQWRMVKSQDVICPFLHGYAPEHSLVSYIQQNPNGAAFSQLLAKEVAEAAKQGGGSKKSA